MSQSQQLRRHLALHVAAHALAEARLGEPFERVAIHEGKADWLGREDALWWRTDEQAADVLIRLAVGLAAARMHELDPSESFVEDDRAKLQQTLESLPAETTLSRDESVWIDKAAEFLASPSHQKALSLIAEDLERYGWLRMEEIDFLIDAADGVDDALEDLQRFRELYDVEPITWPEDT